MEGVTTCVAEILPGAAGDGLVGAAGCMPSPHRHGGGEPDSGIAGGNAAAPAAVHGKSTPHGGELRHAVKRPGGSGAAPVCAQHGIGVGRQTSCTSTPNRAGGEERLGATAPAFMTSTRRSATPLAPRGTSNQALGALAESVGASVTALQQQADADRRRVAALERRLEAAAEERSKESDWRDRLAEVHGSVTGLLEEAQQQARRIDGLEERISLRAGSSEGAKQRSRELEQRLQALEHQSRHGFLSLEEAHKKQASRLCRTEKTSDELLVRMAATEEALRVLQAAQQSQQAFLEDRFNSVEQQHADSLSELQALQLQLAQKAGSPSETAAGPSTQQIDEAFQALERNVASLDKRMCAQIDEISSAFASLRVKVEGGNRRLASLAERFEVTQQSASEGFREELMHLREQDRREIDSSLSEMREQLQHVEEESMAGLQSLRKAQMEMGRLNSFTLEADTWRAMEDRLQVTIQELAAVSQDFTELRAAVEPLVAAGLTEALVEQLQELANASPEWARLTKRLEAVEDWKDVKESNSEQEARTQVGLATTVADTTAQLSQLAVRVAHTEASASALGQSVRTLQEQAAFREGQQDAEEGDEVDLRELDSKVEAMSHRIADVMSRVLEVEGAMEFARHAERGLVARAPPVREAWVQDCGGGAAPPICKGEEALIALAHQLDMIDQLSERMAKLEQAVPECPPMPLHREQLPQQQHHQQPQQWSPPRQSMVQESPLRSPARYHALGMSRSSGSDSGGGQAAPIQLDFLSREVGELHARLRAMELNVDSVRQNFLRFLEDTSVQKVATKEGGREMHHAHALSRASPSPCKETIGMMKLLSPSKAAAASALDDIWIKGQDGQAGAAAADISALSTVEGSGNDLSCSMAGDSFAVDAGDTRVQAEEVVPKTCCGCEELKNHLANTDKVVETEFSEVKSRLGDMERGVADLRSDLNTIRETQLAAASGLAPATTSDGAAAANLAQDVLDSLCVQVAELQQKVDEKAGHELS